MANFWTSAFPPLPPPLLDEFVKSVLAKFFVPTDPYLETAQSFGADLSVHTGTYCSLPPLPNGKVEALEEALAKAKADSRRAFDVLSALPEGRQCFDKHNQPRVTFVAYCPMLCYCLETA